MQIQPITYNNINCGKGPKKPNPNSFVNRVKQKIIDAAPSATFNDDKKRIELWKKVVEVMSKPAENRGVMGATALILQPTIDAANKRVDNDTREISIYRTIAKILAGTSVGMVVRGSTYNLVEKMTDVNGTKAHSQKLLPKKYIQELVKDSTLLKNHRSALSTGLAIAAMCITNFAIDAPLTAFLTNKFTESAILKQKFAAKEVNNAKRA